MQITKNIKNYSIVLKDSREFPITEQQYKIFKMEQDEKKFNDSLEIVDIDTKRVEFDGRWAEFKEFKQKQTQGYGQYTYFCDFGRRHNIELMQHGDGCDCRKELDVVPAFFRYRLMEMGHQIIHPKDVTEDMRTEYKNKYLK